MKILFIGPQGSGKGTQADIAAKRLGVPHISTGDLLRSPSEEVRKIIGDYNTKSGVLLSDEKMLEVLKIKFAEPDCAKGWILDGFPRTLRQAEMLNGITNVDKVVEIHISDEESVRRLMARENCPKCGRNYNEVTRPPRDAGKCDYDGSALKRREDDNPESIKKRLEIYHRDTKPILEMYDSVLVDGEQSVEKVVRDLERVLGR